MSAFFTEAKLHFFNKNAFHLLLGHDAEVRIETSALMGKGQGNRTAMRRTPALPVDTGDCDEFLRLCWRKLPARVSRVAESKGGGVRIIGILLCGV